MWESGRGVGDGAGKQVTECETCTENGKEGGLGKAVVVKVQNMARHVQMIALVLWLSRQHLNRRGDEVNRQAEMANPTKCRDSLQDTTTRLTS
jgi:hypothetical protein